MIQMYFVSDIHSYQGEFKCSSSGPQQFSGTRYLAVSTYLVILQYMLSVLVPMGYDPCCWRLIAHRLVVLVVQPQSCLAIVLSDKNRSPYRILVMCYRIRAADGVVFGCSSVSASPSQSGCTAIMRRIRSQKIPGIVCTIWAIYGLRCAEFNTVLSGLEKGESTHHLELTGKRQRLKQLSNVRSLSLYRDKNTCSCTNILGLTCPLLYSYRTTSTYNALLDN